MDEYTAMIASIALTIGFVIGAWTGSEHRNDTMTAEAAIRGAMVQCVGTEGWHWECDK